MPEIPRRNFLGQVGLGAGILAASSNLGLGYPANETINIGCIGCGGRSEYGLLPALKKIPDTRLVAVCDVWDENLEHGKKFAIPGALSTKDYSKVLDRKDIDAVIIATPDHLHVPILIDACKAGKDVYVEKPLTHYLSEGDVAIAAQNEYKRIVQVGMQHRSMPQFQKANELIRSGRIGKIHKVRLSWNRNRKLEFSHPRVDPKTVDWKRFLGAAREQPFHPYRFRHWRWFWDFGGGILPDLMTHFIDVAHFILDLDHPTTATSTGDFFQAKGVWETPDTIQTMLKYPEKSLEAYFEGTFSNGYGGAMIVFMGTEASLYLDRGRYELYRDEKRNRDKLEEFVPGQAGRGADYDPRVNGAEYHVRNWIDCIRSRKKPNAPVEAGVGSASATHMGNLAYLKGAVVHWDSL